MTNAELTNTERDQPDRPISVALALLDQHWPVCPALTDQVHACAVSEMENDPRYLIGRFQQALTVLLSSALPPMDSQTSLLSQAITDAIAWRLDNGDRPCQRCGDSLCPACSADWDQADRYHALARALGAIGTRPAAPRVRRVTQNGQESRSADDRTISSVTGMDFKTTD
jgi:hypothetical protein